MKKTLIAGAGVAALGFAAMPVLGVFADTSTSKVTDTITVTVPESCAVTSSTTSGSVGNGTITQNTYTAQIQNNQLKSDIGPTGASASGSNVLSVVCNDNTSANATWKLTAVGGDGTTNSTVLKAAGSGTDIATGTATSGATSNWAMKITPASGLTIQNGYDSFKAVPGTAAVIAEGTGSQSGAFTMTYQVWVSATQEADTYTGQVTYTLTSPNA